MTYWIIRIFYAITIPATLFPCDPVDGPRIKWTKSQRQGARELALNHLEARGAHPNFLAYVDSVTVRESSANPSRWHDGGNGLGLHGINIAIHEKRSPEPLNPGLCDPRVSADVVQAIARDAIVKHGAKNAWDLQAVYAGRIGCVGEGDGKCTSAQQDRTTAAICSRMEARGYDCFVPIKLKDLGRMADAGSTKP